ncbi:hypothetical protein Tco_1517211 [Tanacetum coccineum]
MLYLDAHHEELKIRNLPLYPLQSIDEQGYHLVPSLSLVFGPVCASYVLETHLSLLAQSPDSQPTWTRIYNVPINPPQGSFHDNYEVVMSLTQDDTHDDTLYMVINREQLAKFSSSSNAIALTGLRYHFLVALCFRCYVDGTQRNAARKRYLDPAGVMTLLELEYSVNCSVLITM